MKLTAENVEIVNDDDEYYFHYPNMAVVIYGDAKQIKQQILDNQEIVEKIQNFVKRYSDLSQLNDSIDPSFLTDIKEILGATSEQSKLEEYIEEQQCPTMFRYNQCGGYKGHPGPCEDIHKSVFLRMKSND